MKSEEGSAKFFIPLSSFFISFPIFAESTTSLMQNLNFYISLGDFAKNWKGEPGTFTIHLQDLCIRAAERGDTIYGLKLLKEAFQLYESHVDVKPGKRKASIPFFRDNQARLIGPEMGLFVQSLYEKQDIVPDYVAKSTEPWLRITLDYAQLADYCLSNDLYLIRCKYNRDKNIQVLAERVVMEYDNIYYTKNEVGFKPESRFFSILYNAILEMENPRYATKNPEWRLIILLPPEEAEYKYENGKLQSYLELDLPTTSILDIQLLPDIHTQIGNYTNLVGLLKKMGVKAEEVVKEMKEEE